MVRGWGCRCTVCLWAVLRAPTGELMASVLLIWSCDCADSASCGAAARPPRCWSPFHWRRSSVDSTGPGGDEYAQAQPDHARRPADQGCDPRSAPVQRDGIVRGGSSRRAEPPLGFGSSVLDHRCHTSARVRVGVGKSEVAEGLSRLQGRPHDMSLPGRFIGCRTSHRLKQQTSAGLIGQFDPAQGTTSAHAGPEIPKVHRPGCRRGP